MPVAPYGGHPDAPRLFIHQNGRIPYAPGSPQRGVNLGIINGDFDIRPGAASVRGAAYAHINVGRKVSGMVVPDIVHGQQGSLPGTGQTGNTVEF